MKKQKTLWKRLLPEHKQAIKGIKDSYSKHSFEKVKNSLKNETNWMELSHGVALVIIDECGIFFLGDAFKL
jgi:hypothetical protein